MDEKTCPAFKRCGSCQLLDLPYNRQLLIKQSKVKRLLSRYKKPEKIVGMKNPYHYRNKVQAAFGMSRGRIISGVYQSSSHKIVSADGCLLEDKKADEIIADIRKMCPNFKIKAYDEKSETGQLRHVLVRRGFETGEIMVVLVTAMEELRSANSFVNELLRRHPDITTVVQNINGGFTSLVLGERQKILFGKGYIEDVLCGLKFRISPKSFYQVNPVQTKVLYNKAIGYADLSGEETVFDAYCGIGTIGLCAASHAKKVVGVELNKTAVSDAKRNAELNGITNAEFYAADAGLFMENAAQNGQRPDVVFMDPPRAGSSIKFLKSLLKTAPEKIVYISCNPETMARDLAFLTEDYAVDKLCPVDMFPHTEHIETVCLLVLRNPVTHINIDVDVEEMVQDKRGLATYEQIKDYVLEHSGLKVSSLYIAQVKQKYGIIERENYNKPKSEDARQPQCPLEKERAITEALKHFGML